MAAPEVSIVIRTYNEEKHLPGLLENLRRQSYRDFEIIVVDSGSVDKTRDIASRTADKLIRIDRHNFTFGYSLNAGIRSAAGEFAAIVSAHTLPADENWLAALLQPLRDDRTAMVFGRQMGGMTSKFSEVQDLKRSFSLQRRILNPPGYIGNNANSAIRKKLWAQYPFDETLPGLEDIGWAKYWLEHGYQVVYEPAAALYHLHEENWQQISRRYYREAVAAKWIGLKGKRHIVLDPAREVSYLFADLGAALLGSAAPATEKPPFLDRCIEIVKFRTSKSVGTVKGLLDGATLQNQATRETIYFDRPCKAVVIRAPGEAGLEEIEIPKVNPGEVLIRVAYEGICGTDLEILNGTLGYYKEGLAKYPIVPGHEFSGQIVNAGSAVLHLKEGDRVVVECIQSCGHCEECRRSNAIGCPDRTELGVIGRNGGYAEYVVVPGQFVHRLPAGFDMRMAALCEPLAVVLKGFKRLSRGWPTDQKQKKCAVIGAGAIGHLFARVLAYHGHAVTVFDRNAARLACFDRSSIGCSGDLDQLNHFDILIEATGHQEVLETVLRASPAGASILLLGLPYERKEFTFENIVAYDKTVIGSVGSGGEDFEEAIRLLPKLDVRSFLGCVVPFEQFKPAWEKFRTAGQLKILLEVSKDFVS